MKITKSQLQKIIKEELLAEAQCITDEGVERAIEMLQQIRDDAMEPLENRAYSGVHLAEKLDEVMTFLGRGY